MLSRPLNVVDRSARISGLSPHGSVTLAQFGRRRGQSVADALREWALFLSNPHHRLYDPKYPGCGYWGCCTDPDEVRSYLEAAAHVLPPQDARRFRKRLAELDERW